MVSAGATKTLDLLTPGLAVEWGLWGPLFLFSSFLLPVGGWLRCIISSHFWPRFPGTAALDSISTLLKSEYNWIQKLIDSYQTGFILLSGHLCKRFEKYFWGLNHI
jgi:hypothetical protein